MKISNYIDKTELNKLLQKSNSQGFYTLSWNWLLIVFSFFLVAFFPNPISIVIALIIIGGRQHGLGVLMHDASHNSLFKSKALNQFFGQWFCAYPILANLNSYREAHLTHHKKAGTKQDPDLPHYQNYPVTKASLKRKLIRDMTGQTGLKVLYLILIKRRDLLTLHKGQKAKLLGPLLVNFIIFSILYFLGYGLLYLLWVGAYLTTYTLFLRIRQIAEHGAVPNLFDLEPRKNTRTTIARWWERLTVAPNFVNYHLEHHILATVPPHHLKKLHHLLSEKHYFDNTFIAHGYGDILKLAAK